VKNKYSILFAVAIILVAAILFPGLLLKKTRGFPQELGGLTLIGVETGDSALESIGQLHGFSSRLKMTDAYIIDYSGEYGKSVTIWISRAENHEKAFQQVQYMAKAIDPKDGFTNPERVNLDNIPTPAVFYVEGFGSQHYYYVKKNSVYWITITNITMGKHMETVEEVIIKIE
jgi:hypothetical protein